MYGGIFFFLPRGKVSRGLVIVRAYNIRKGQFIKNKMVLQNPFMIFFSSTLNGFIEKSKDYIVMPNYYNNYNNTRDTVKSRF